MKPKRTMKTHMHRRTVGNWTELKRMMCIQQYSRPNGITDASDSTRLPSFSLLVFILLNRKTVSYFRTQERKKASVNYNQLFFQFRVLLFSCSRTKKSWQVRTSILIVLRIHSRCPIAELSFVIRDRTDRTNGIWGRAQSHNYKKKNI